MKASEFKTNIKAIKNQLRGLTIQLITSNGSKPFRTLREFGNAVLEEESFGNGFNISKVWIGREIVSISSFNHFLEVLKSESINAIQIFSYQHIENECGFMRSFGSLD